jgi:hypothetical protein
MSAAVTSAATNDAVTAKDDAALIAEHFRQYNEELGRITRRAALNSLAEDWQKSQLDAVARIELYEERVARCVAAIASDLRSKRTEVALWTDIKRSPLRGGPTAPCQTEQDGTLFCAAKATGQIFRQLRACPGRSRPGMLWSYNTALLGSKSERFP